MADFLAQVWQSIMRRPLTYFLALLSLGIGASAYLCVVALGEKGLSELEGDTRLMAAHPVIEAYVRLNTRRKDLAPLPEASVIAQRLQGAMGHEVAFTQQYVADAKAGRVFIHEMHVDAVSGNFRPDFRNGLLKVEGRWLNDRDARSRAAVCVISQMAAEQLLRGGKALGSQIRLDGWPFMVVGVMHSASTRGARMSQVAEVPYEVAQQRFRKMPLTGPRLLALTNEEDVSKDLVRVPAALRQTLGRGRRGLFLYTEALSPWLQAHKTLRIFALVRIGLGVLATLLLLTGLLGMASMLLANLNSRIHEIGVHRALGATRARQAALVLCEATGTGLVAGIVGLLMGSAMLRFIAALFAVDLPVTPGWAVAAVVVTAVTSLLTGLIPARAAMRISPAESLRAE